MNEIPRIVVYEAVVRELLTYIKKQNLKTGDRLSSERELAKTMNVSRNSVREALQILASFDAVIIKHGSGIYVNLVEGMLMHKYTTIDEQEMFQQIKEILQARLMLETYCSIEVSKTITEAQLQALYEREKYESEILFSEKTVAEGTSSPSMSLEIMITTFFDNPILINFHKKLDSAWKEYLKNLNYVPHPAKVRHKDHLEIIHAIESKNREKIEKAIYQHLHRTLNAIDKLLAHE